MQVLHLCASLASSAVLYAYLVSGQRLFGGDDDGKAYSLLGAMGSKTQR